MKKTIRRLLLGGAGGLVAFAVLAPMLLGNLGASTEEQTRPLPGDARIPQPKIATTQAITIHATPSQVWPWLVQMGQGRGGLYSYDALENLVGCDIHSVDRIVPELQELIVGDEIWLDRRMPGGYRVTQLEPSRALVLVTGDVETASTWVFFLVPQSDRSTRLLVRSRLTYPDGLGPWLMWRGVTEPLHVVMQEKMLRGIRDRAEQAEAPLTSMALR